MKLKEKMWILNLPSGRVPHLARAGEGGAPKSETLCGKDTSERKRGARFGDTITGKICEPCERKLHSSWRVSDLRRDDSDLKTHLHEGSGAVCGQKLARNFSDTIRAVTCDRCREIATSA
jgi:hypothetical protein